MFKRYTLHLIFVLLAFTSKAQSDTARVSLKEITVTGYRDESEKLSSYNIESLSVDSVKSGAYTLTDVIAKIPGVSMLSTGTGISKPVIRGLYGNRVLVLLNGLRFDNQQWQEEHGLGLSSSGISKIELIKGPFGILYGTEALGGVINILDEEKPDAGKKIIDATLSLCSNTGGLQGSIGYRKATQRSWYKLRVGFENHADYSDGNQQRVLNSRFNAYSVKASYGFLHKKWKSENSFSSSYNRYGFIFNDIYTFLKPDERWSRALQKNPAHMVLLNYVSSENTYYRNNRSRLQINAGIQSNSRMENEGGGAISLNMHLLTLQYIMRYEYDVNEKNRIILSHLNTWEDNTNYGARKIVPDARMQEANLSMFFEHHVSSTFLWENGAGVGEKYIHTFFTPTVNGQGKEIQPFQKSSPYYNIFTGFTYFPTEKINIKCNLSSGVRVANLAELSSNGLHEGVFTYEIGDPSMKNEQLFSANTFINIHHRKWRCSISPFYNYFLHYIYLAPTREQWFGFPVYRYKQQTVTQYGMEAVLSYTFNAPLLFEVSYSGMVSKTAQGDYTPFVPAQKIVPLLQYRRMLSKRFPVTMYAKNDIVFAQPQTAPYEIGGKAYTLYHAGFGLELRKHWTVQVQGNNLFNKAYIDHLSRFKYYDLLNPGRNVVLTVKKNLGS